MSEETIDASPQLERVVSVAIGKLSLILIALDCIAEASPVFEVGPSREGGDWALYGAADMLRDVITDLEKATGTEDSKGVRNGC